MAKQAVRVLMVCLGNICRSPLAEVVMRQRAIAIGAAADFSFASAGTGSWHIGHGADVRSAATAKQHGLDLSQHRAQQVTTNNVARWDWLVAMDRQNHADLLRMGANPERLLLMRQFETTGDDGRDVPDPYYGGESGFEHAYQLLHHNAGHMLCYLQDQEGL